MIYYFLYLEVQFRAEVIERVLRVVRHRGFMLHALHILPCGHSVINQCKFHVHMALSGKRSIHILYEHLKKLTDVSYVAIQNDNTND